MRHSQVTRAYHCRSTTKSCATLLRQLQLSGQRMVETAARGGQGRMASGRTLPPGRFRRDQPVPFA